MVSHRILSGNLENVAHFPFSQILFRLALSFAEFTDCASEVYVRNQLECGEEEILARNSLK